MPASVHIQQGTHLLSPKQRRDTFYKYEKRIRELSTQEKARCCIPARSCPHPDACSLDIDLIDQPQSRSWSAWLFLSMEATLV